MKHETEIWKDVPNYVGLYQVSNLGKVKRLISKNCLAERLLKITKFKKRKNGTNPPKVILSKNAIHVFFVAKMFVPNPNNNLRKLK